LQSDVNLPVSSGPRSATSSGPPGRRLRGRHSAGRQPLRPGSRVVAVGVLAGIGFALIVFQYQIRHLEAVAAAHLYNLVTPAAALPGAPVITFGPGTPGGFGLVITPDCSMALLIAPLCGLGMVLIRPRRAQVRRAAKALAVASLVMVAGDLVRIGSIAMTIRMDGIDTGYQISNLMLGPVVSIVCIALSLALLALMLRSPGAPAPASPNRHPGFPESPP
jgi:exosortase/archaeosortase